MPEFTMEMVEKLNAANDALKGTAEYHKYRMECEYKYKGKWKFAGHAVPTKPGKLKTYKGTTYIIIEDGSNRYTVTEAVKELLEI